MEVKIQIPDNCELIKDGDTYIVKEKRQQPPKSWEEFCERYPITKDEVLIDNYGGIIPASCSIGKLRGIESDRYWYSSREEAEAFIALIQLRQLRKVWVGDWNPLGKCYYAIIFSIETGLKIGDYVFTYRVLSFPTKEMAEEFLECFKNLCETAKILL